MKVLKSIRRSNILKVEEDFAALRTFSVQRASSVYEFCYTIDIVKALNRGLTDVRIRIHPIDPPKPDSIFVASDLVLGQIVKPAPKQVIANILQLTPKEKDQKNANVNAVLKTIETDVDAKINNDLKTTIKTISIKPADIQPSQQFVTKTIKSLKVNTPILQISKLQPGTKPQTIPAMSVKSIFEDKKDPSESLANAQFVTPAKKSFGGLLKLKPPAKRALKGDTIIINALKVAPITNTDDLLGEAVVQLTETQTITTQKIQKKVLIKQAELPNYDSFFVTFELRNANGIVVEKIGRKVPHGKNLKVIQTPVIAPDISVAPVSVVGRNIVTVRQMDSNANRLRMFRKRMVPTRRLEDIEYEFVQDIDISIVDGAQQVVDFTSNVNNVIYRFIPVGPQDQLGAEYTNVVAPGVRQGVFKKAERPLFAGVVGSVVADGIRVQVVSVSPGPVSVKVVRKDHTLFEKNFTTVIPHETTNASVLLIEGDNPPGSFLDRSVVNGHKYEYCVKLIFANGDEEFATGCEFIEFVPLSQGVVDTKLTTPQIVDREGAIDVQFKINSKVLAKDLDIVKSLLEKQGLATLFETELLNEKSSLQKLLAHSVRRVDLSTGDSEFFQTFTGTVFSDLDNRQISSVSPLKSGHKYRYYVSALLRTAETVFEDNVETITNGAGIEVEVLPLKFRHPIPLKLGNLVTTRSLKRNHSEDPFEFGGVGNVTEANANLESALPRLTNGRANRFNNGTNVVRWQVLGDKDLIDHFIVILDRLGQEEVVGKAHALFDSDFIEFVDKLDNDEVGSMRYRIIPVLTSYEHGSSISTNEVIV